MRTIDKMEQLHGVPHDDSRGLKKAMTPRIANEGILCVLIRQIKTDADILKFCDSINQLVDSTTSKQCIDTLRNGTSIVLYITFCMYWVLCLLKAL